MNYIRPGYFGVVATADERRTEYDCKNLVLIENKVEVDVVFFGDSITRRWELDAFFTTKNCKVNRGIGGDTAFYAEKRFKADVVQLKPKLCVCLIGINDSWEFEQNAFRQIKPAPLEKVLENTYNSIKSIVKMAKGANITLALGSVLPTNMTFTEGDETRNIYVKMLNEKVKKLCESENVIFVDYFSEFISEDGKKVKDGLTLEGLHPNTAGYNIMTKMLKEKLLENNISI